MNSLSKIKRDSDCVNSRGIEVGLVEEVRRGDLVVKAMRVSERELYAVLRLASAATGVCLCFLDGGAAILRIVGMVAKLRRVLGCKREVRS